MSNKAKNQDRSTKKTLRISMWLFGLIILSVFFWVFKPLKRRDPERLKWRGQAIQESIKKHPQLYKLIEDDYAYSKDKMILYMVPYQDKNNHVSNTTYIQIALLQLYCMRQLDPKQYYSYGGMFIRRQIDEVSLLLYPLSFKYNYWIRRKLIYYKYNWNMEWLNEYDIYLNGKYRYPFLGHLRENWELLLIGLIKYLLMLVGLIWLLRLCVIKAKRISWGSKRHAID